MTVTDEALTHAPAGDGRGGTGGDTAGARVAAALARDLDEGFAALYEAYRGAVFSTALRLCGRWAEAEDLSAEAFLRAYRALTGYEAGRIAELRPRAWLLTILTNVWRNSLRSAARRPPPGPIEDAPDPPDPGEGVEDAAARHETGRELAGLLARLPHQQRAAVVLRHVTDLPVAEIAAVLDLPEGTVKSHISRGLARLRALRTAPGTPGPDRSAPDPEQKGGNR
ncbi:RNA polymerase sigma factor [Actinomadura mexicana]|uniref:RNA polymerase sigma-70 factor, ECF subfamily n=1 Tax=Actinomadura mexicana TaxID=134959 RepID=A0A238Z9X0_9ACTN|nr:RNA polymerase sigma factor [Actinomadura mexicana]SNR80335.1 RNA polymerase sigma-70 factor, ECF subfamily [Actinomadura mexicana]